METGDEACNKISRRGQFFSEVTFYLFPLRPHCNQLLAVGASTGVLLWNVDPTSPTTRCVGVFIYMYATQSYLLFCLKCPPEQKSCNHWSTHTHMHTHTRFLTTWVRVESSPGHTPVTSISWSPHGNFLVSASPADYSLITWDIPMGVATRIRRSGGGGVTMVTWSPDGQRVFAGCASSMFRMWETQKWTCEKWTNTTGRCKVRCNNCLLQLSCRYTFIRR